MCIILWLAPLDGRIRFLASRLCVACVVVDVHDEGFWNLDLLGQGWGKGQPWKGNLFVFWVVVFLPLGSGLFDRLVELAGLLCISACFIGSFPTFGSEAYCFWMQWWCFGILQRFSTFFKCFGILGSTGRLGASLLIPVRIGLRKRLTACL